MSSHGGERLSGELFDHGFYVELTIIDGLPLNHDFFHTELFLPITVIGEVDGLEQASELANETAFGLTAGIFSEDESEIQGFYNGIEAGTIYVNRRAGATAGAWPVVNPFGGWKGSASTGVGAGGPYYLQQFMREQSRVRIFKSRFRLASASFLGRVCARGEFARPHRITDLETPMGITELPTLQPEWAFRELLTLTPEWE